MTTHTEKLIQDGLWRDISEAPRDESDIMLLIPSIKPPFDFGHYCTTRKLFEGRSFQHDYDAIKHQPTHFRPLPDDRLANALKVAVEALRESELIVQTVIDEPTQKALVRCPVDVFDVVHQALAEIDRIAKGEE